MRLLGVRFQSQLVSEGGAARIFSPGLSALAHKTSNTDIVLRPYQDECISSCLTALKSGLSRIAVSLATGGGKTVIFTNLIPQLARNPVSSGEKVLILVHRKELAEQLAATVAKFLPHYRVEIDMAKEKATHTADVTVASVQTLKNPERLSLYRPDEYKAIIVDECHHAVSPSYISVFDHFNVLSLDSKIPLLGFSATLRRHDKIPLGKVFQKVVYNKDLLDMINGNWLADITVTPVYASLGLDEVPLTNSGDYDLACLGRYVNTPQVNELVLRTYLKYKQQLNIKSLLFFCVNVDHLRKLSDLLRLNGINCQYVTGSTKKSERKLLVEEFKNGEIDVLMNCGVFTEGTDIPNIDSVFIVRPTKSRPLLIQMIGRGLRLHRDKEKCHIIDFVDIKETGVELKASLLGSMARTGAGLQLENTSVVRTPQVLEQDMEIKTVQYKTYDNIHEYLEEIKKTGVSIPDHVIMKKHKLPWIQVGRHSWLVSLSFNKYLRIDLNKLKQYELKQYYSGILRYNIKSVPLSKSLELSQLLKNIDEMDIDITTTYKSFSSTITTKQHSFLEQKFMTSIEDSKINPTEFRAALNEKLKMMTKAVAKDLIFGYSVGGKYCLQQYIKSKILPKKVIDTNQTLLL